MIPYEDRFAIFTLEIATQSLTFQNDREAIINSEFVAQRRTRTLPQGFALR
jgi:hypothetical protein